VHIITLFIAQIIISVGCSYIATNWEFHNEQAAWYLGMGMVDQDGNKVDTDSFYWQWFKNIGAWILIFTNFVPISLLVTLEVVKFSQKYAMEWDLNMFDYEKQEAAIGSKSVPGGSCIA
jgi:phospholipid-transporting ATPase